MSTYFVRKSGNDASAGTSPATAWQTIGKAIGSSGIASGDTVYIGAGTYRETLTATMSVASVETKVIGDIDGKQTGDAGPVIWTAYTTNDTSAPAATYTLDLNVRNFLTFENLVIIGGNAYPSCVANYSTATDIIFRRCAFISAYVSGPLLYYTATAGTAANWTVDKCVFAGSGTVGAVEFSVPTKATSDYDLNYVFKNCLFRSMSYRNVYVSSSGALSNKGGGIDFRNCTSLSWGPLLEVASANISTSIPCVVSNCYINSGPDTGLKANTAGQITSDHNRIIAATPYSNVTAGTGDVSTMNYAPLLELIQSWYPGILPVPDGMPMASSPVLAVGTATGAPSDDILGFTRPNPPSIGAFERNLVAQRVKVGHGMDGGMRG